MATNKKTSRQKNNKKQPPQEGSMRNEIIILVTLALCILLLLSNFGLVGFVGKWLSNGMKFLFGWIAYPFPFVLFFSTVFIVLNEGVKRAYFKIGCFLLLIILLCTFLQLIKSSGGVIGGLLVKLLDPLVGTVGTYTIVIVLILICLVLITNKSILSGVKKGGQFAYEKSVQSGQKHRARREQRAAEAEQGNVPRKDRIVSGVNTNATIPKTVPDVKEILPPKGKVYEPIEETEEIPITSYKEMQASSIPFFGGDDSFTNKDDSQPVASKKPIKTEPRTIEKEDKAIEIEIPKKTNLKQDNYKTPPLNLLKKGKSGVGDSKSHVEAMAKKLAYTLEVFHVDAMVTNVTQGPSITRFEIKLNPGVKVDKIVKLKNEIMLYMKASSIRIEAPIPGKDAVGIEVPNETSVMVRLRDLFETPAYQEMKSNLTFAVGKDISGKPVITDIAKMPHLLIAGATGSGKSVGINTLIMSILYKVHKDDVKMIMIDPKVVELSIYNNIPHLMIPVVTDPKKAANALNWAVSEMEKRYMTFAALQVRDLESYHNKIATHPNDDSDTKLNKYPQIIIIVDEMADLMMVAKAEVETAICRLAQKARAAGIHLILATQRPSVDVITGLIKANMPSRISFKTTSGTDSRTILDMNGAENLLGNGDMFFYPASYPLPERVQGAFISDTEVESVVDYLVKQNGEAAYDSEVEEEISKDKANVTDQGGSPTPADDKDDLFFEAGQFIIEKEKASIGMLQRVFKIGFNRAARIMDQLADAQVVGGEEGTKARQILMTMSDFEDYMDNQR